MRPALLSSGITVIACVLMFGQAKESLTFEVASVKPSAALPQFGGRGGVFFGPARGGPGTASPEQITWSNATLKSLLTTAYDVKNYQVNGPAWLDTERYDIVAKVPAGATKEQVNVMWQNLLADRFGVKLHHESKDFQVEELVVAKGGSKLKASAEDPNAPVSDPGAPPVPPGPPKLDKNGFPELIAPGMVNLMDDRSFDGPTALRTVGKAQSLSEFATLLGNQLKHPVVDKTGLTGKFDFAIEYTPDLGGLPLPPPPPGEPGRGPAQPTPSDNAAAPVADLAATIQQVLGLRLVLSKASLTWWSSIRQKKFPPTTDVSPLVRVVSSGTDLARHCL